MRLVASLVLSVLCQVPWEVWPEMSVEMSLAQRDLLLVQSVVSPGQLDQSREILEVMSMETSSDQSPVSRVMFQGAWAQLQEQWGLLQARLARSSGTWAAQLPALQERLGALPGTWGVMSQEKFSEEVQELSQAMESALQASQEQSEA